jgi:hypothetical protein
MAVFSKLALRGPSGQLPESRILGTIVAKPIATYLTRWVARLLATVAL